MRTIDNVGIYKLYWQVPGFYYVGQSINLKGRLDQHIKQMKTGIHCVNKVQEAYNRFGEPETLILKNCTPDELDHYEHHFINLDFNKELCCNKQKTHDTIATGIRLSKEDFKVISRLANGKGENNGVRGYIERLVKQHLSTVNREAQ